MIEKTNKPASTTRKNNTCSGDSTFKGITLILDGEDSAKIIGTLF